MENIANKLHGCADSLQGRVGKSRYKYYILPLVFYAAINRRVQDSAIDTNVSIPNNYSWEELRTIEQNVAEEIDTATERFERDNNCGKLFTTSFASVTSLTTDGGDNALRDVISVIDEVVYQQEKELPSDILGQVFMSLIERFSVVSQGQYFTPPEVTRLVVSLLAPFEDGTTFHDPTVGSGGMLVQAARHYEQEQDNNASDLYFTGQELNPSVAAIARMNLLLNDIEGRIEQGDALSDPQFTVDGELAEFDYILANFPFSESGWKSDTKARQETFGDLDWSDSLPHGNYADCAFIMHMMSHLSDSGRLATIIPHGVLFRNHDQPYREYMIENDLVEAVIGLPENLFIATGIPSAVLMLNNDKPSGRTDTIQFINADQERFYEDTGNDRNVLTEGGVGEIVQLHGDNEDIERVSRIVSRGEIAGNNYNMNIALYIDTTEQREDIDVNKSIREIGQIEDEYSELEEQFSEYMEQLDYE